MRLLQYFDLIENSLHSRRDAEVEHLVTQVILPERSGVIEGRVRFWDGSLLRFDENLTIRGVTLIRQRYAYHYQDAADRLIFRYDNVPHHPEVPTHPHHKHVGEAAGGTETIVATVPPDLAAVLAEIARIHNR